MKVADILAQLQEFDPSEEVVFLAQLEDGRSFMTCFTSEGDVSLDENVEYFDEELNEEVSLGRRVVIGMYGDNVSSE